MRRFFRWDKKYLYWGITGFCVIAAAILFYMALNYLPILGKGLGKLVNILSPVIWGLVITYLLSPLTRMLERSVFDPFASRLYKAKKRGKARRLARGLSVLLSELVLLAILTALVYLIIPQLYSSIETIVQNSGTYAANISAWAEKLLKDYPEVQTYIEQQLNMVNNNLWDWLRNNVLPQLGSFVSSVSTGVMVAVRGVYNLIIGIVVSIYILGNKEAFSANARRLLYSVFSVEAAERLREGVAFTDKTFMGFINGKLLDSAIIGLICYIVCAILNMPYTLLVSVIIGVTNIIPFFGPLIGAVPCALLILMVNPTKFLVFIIFIVVLQQVDGNIIGPKILGNSIGINGFWVLFAILLGGGFFGFWGMLLGVPVFVVIYTLVNARIDKKLQRSDLPWKTEDYMDLDHVDPATRQVVKKSAAGPGPKAKSEAAPQNDQVSN